MSFSLTLLGRLERGQPDLTSELSATVVLALMPGGQDGTVRMLTGTRA